MHELEPGAGERLGEGLRIVEEPARDLLVGRIEAQREVRRQHLGLVLLRLVVRIRNDLRRILCHPLDGAGRALLLHPFELEQVLEEVVAPLRGRVGPGHLDARADGVAGLAGLVGARPAHALRLDGRVLGVRADMRGGARAVRLAEGVAAGDQRHGLLVVHRHAREGLADVFRSRERIAVGVRAFGVHIDEAHLHGGERVLEVALAGVALVSAEPGLLAAPVHVLVGFPGVLAAGTEAEGAEAHGFQCHVAGEDQQVGPGDGLAVLLLDRPQQAPRLVDVHVVGPAVERREALLPATAAATSVAHAIRARGMPGHADELRAVVAEVRRPPVLRIRHQREQVFLQRRVVELLELLGVVELRAQRIGPCGMLVQQVQAKLVRPPVSIRRAATRGVVDRALGFGSHGRVVPCL